MQLFVQVLTLIGGEIIHITGHEQMDGLASSGIGVGGCRTLLGRHPSWDSSWHHYASRNSHKIGSAPHHHISIHGRSWRNVGA